MARRDTYGVVFSGGIGTPPLMLTSNCPSITEAELMIDRVGQGIGPDYHRAAIYSSENKHVKTFNLKRITVMEENRG